MTTQTSRLSIVIDTANAQSNIERLRTSLHRLGTDGTTASNILSRMGATGGLSNIINRVGQTNNAFRQFSQMVNNTHNNFNTFNRTVNNASTNIMRMGDTINRTTNNITRMGDTINRNITVINNYNRSLSGTHDALSRLQGILTGGMFGVFALSLAKTADSMQETHSQIKLVTKSHEEYLVVADRLHEMAGKNLKDFQATAGLYTNSARALGQLGKSQEEVLKFTNAVSLAMSVGGKSAQEQASALLQLGQAMQSGALQGDEFRSVAENAPILLDLIAEKLGKTRAEIKELGSDGKITSMVIHDALADATPKLQEMFDKMPVTMSQGFSVLKNEYKKFTHEFMNGEGGISSVVAKGLVDVSRNFENFATILMGTAATWGVLKVAQSSFVTTTIPALIAGTTGSISTFYAQGVAMLTTATSTSALSRALTMATLRGASFAVSVAVGTREILRKAVAIGTATRTFLAHSASVLRSSMSVAGLRANIGLLTRSVLTNTGAFWRGTVAVQAKTLAMGALGVASRATAGTVGVLAGSIKSLGAIINAHPIMFLSTVIFGVVASTEGLQGAMDSLSDTVKVVGSIFGEFVTVSSYGLKETLGGTIDFFANKFVKGSKDSTKLSETVFKTFFDDTEKGFLGIIQVVARIFDMAGASIASFVKLGIHSLANLGIGAINAVEKVKEFFGGTANYQEYYETNLYAIMEEIAPKIFGNGLEVFVNHHIGGVMAKKKEPPKVDLTVPSQAQTPSSSDKDKDKKGKKGKDDDFNNRPLSLSIYRALVDEGASHNQALALVAEIGRENDFNADLIFGTHTDPARDKKGRAIKNYGMVSWNGGREKPVMDSIRQAGLIDKNGKMIRSQETLRIQARHLLNEALDPKRSGKLQHFLNNPNADPESFSKELGKYLIAWAYGQNTIRGENGKRIPFDWLKHDRRRRNHLKTITNLVNNSGYKGGRSTKDQIKEYENQQQTRDELVKQYLTPYLVGLDNELSQQIAKINESKATEQEKQDMIQRAKAIYTGKKDSYQADFLLKTQSHILSPEQVADFEYIIELGEALANPKFDLDQLNQIRKHLKQVKDDKKAMIALDEQERNLEINRYTMPKADILKQEKDIDVGRKNLSRQYTPEQLMALEQWYDKRIEAQKKADEYQKQSMKFEIEQYNMNVLEKIEAQRKLAHLQLEANEDMSITELAWHKEIVDKKYDYEEKQAKEARNKILTDAKNDYERLKHVYLNHKDKYAGLRYGLQKDENNYSTVEIDTIIEQHKKNQTFQSFVDLQNRLKETRFNPLEHGDYFSALSGTAGLMQTTWQNYDTTKEQHQNELEQLKARLDEKQITEEEYRQEREQLEKRHQDSMLQLSLASGGGVLNGLTQMAKHAIGEQSNTYRTMYQLTKAFYLAEAGLAVYKAGSDAWANEKGTTWQKVAAAAKAVALSSDFVRLISSANPKGFKTGGYTGNIGTSQIAGVVHGQEYVVNAKATKRIGVDNLNKLNSGGSLGGVNIVINNYTNEKASVEQMPNGDFMVTIGKMIKQMSRAEARQVMYEESRQGGMLDRRR